MENNLIKIKSIKVAPHLPLDRISRFFNTQMKLNWSEYIPLSGSELDLILKYDTVNKHALIFKFGCISFVNFEDDEIYNVIKYIESFNDKINYALFYKYYETHTIKVPPSRNIKLWENSKSEYPLNDLIIHIISIVLAKSTELYRYEIDLSKLLDDAERFIVFLQKGRLGFHRKKSSLLIAKMLRFEYEGIHNIRILDRPAFVDQNTELREIYDALSKYYEFDERFSILIGKMNSLRDILKVYSKLSLNQAESRILKFEIFLLTLFPLFHLFRHMLEDAAPLGFLTNLLK